MAILRVFADTQRMASPTVTMRAKVKVVSADATMIDVAMTSASRLWAVRKENSTGLTL